MPFVLKPNEELFIEGTTYWAAEHPIDPDTPCYKRGRHSIVYKLISENEEKALKVLEPRSRSSSLISLAQRIEEYAQLSGLEAAKRIVITPQKNPILLKQYADLIYSILMPWVDGTTWSETISERKPLAPHDSLKLATNLTKMFATLEQKTLAHCNISGENVILKRSGQIALVDLESIYGPGLTVPQALSSGSPGYAHKTAKQKLWKSTADRFSGAILLAEVLGWCDERIVKESQEIYYFNPNQLQKDCEAYNLLAKVIKENWGEEVSYLFDRAWQSITLTECPTFKEWLAVLPQQVPDISFQEEKEAIKTKTPQQQPEPEVVSEQLKIDEPIPNIDIAVEKITTPKKAIGWFKQVGRRPCPHCNRLYRYDYTICPYCRKGRDEPVKKKPFIKKGTLRQLIIWTIGVAAIAAVLNYLYLSPLSGQRTLPIPNNTVATTLSIPINTVATIHKFITETFSVPANKVETAVLKIDFDYSLLNISPLTDSENYLEVSVYHNQLFAFNDSGSEKDHLISLVLENTKSGSKDPLMDIYKISTKISISPNNSTSLDIDIINGYGDLDLSALELTDLKVRTVYGSFKIQLPAGNFPANFDSGSGSYNIITQPGTVLDLNAHTNYGSITISLVEGVSGEVLLDTSTGTLTINVAKDVGIQISGQFGSKINLLPEGWINISGNFFNGTYQSPNFEKVESKVYITIQSRAGSVEVKIDQ